MDVVKHARWLLMATLSLTPMSVALASSMTASCGTKQWQSAISEAANRFQIPQSWVHAVMRIESAGCAEIDGSPTTSHAGAMGLMQLMPATWIHYRRRLLLGDDPYNPRDNILAGVAYLHDLYERYGSPGLFAAYQAGETRYDDYLSGGRSLPRATLDYLARVQALCDCNAPQKANITRTLDITTRSVFVARQPNSDDRGSSAEVVSAREIFVRLSGEKAMRSEPAEQSDVQKE